MLSPKRKGEPLAGLKQGSHMTRDVFMASLRPGVKSILQRIKAGDRQSRWGLVPHPPEVVAGSPRELEVGTGKGG